MEREPNPVSKHFRLEQLAAGVYAAIHQDGGLAASNAGIVDLGDRLLVFDTFFSPQAATDLRAVAEAITGSPVDFVVNSHWHHDHTWGNQVFSPETDIVSTLETRQLMATQGVAIIAEFQQTAPEILASWQARLDASDDVGQRRQFSTWVDYYRSCVEAQPSLQLRLPNLTFVERFSIQGAKRAAEVIACGAGHTQSDTILFLPDDDIVFMGDLLFVGYQPYLGAGDPDQLLRILDMVRTLDADTFVPGHGPVGHRNDLALLEQYISTLNVLARQLLAEGQTADHIDAMSLPEPFGDWLYASFFVENLRFLYQRRLEGREGIEYSG